MGLFTKDIECKEVFGKTICNVKASGATLLFPTNRHNQIPLQFFTSKSCPEHICNDTQKSLFKMNNELHNLFKINIIQADRVRTPAQVITIPTIMIGNQTIIGKDFGKISLLEAAKHHFANE